MRISIVEPQQGVAVHSSPDPGAIGRYAMKKILTVIALATLIASPAVAATRHHQAMQSPAQQLQSSPPIFMYAPDSPSIIDPARAAALHECSTLASKFSNSAWQTTQFAQFGTCMTEHGQQP